ncbi:peptidase inhibitor family I36 protein [Streptomyces sp. NPDC090022]|uniref:peptidase inhibitor family I36 protein n=1 Tax=Streptomyces sp. NPDC090022 TaxID=3365920 RepID=UPI00382E0070
MKRIRCTGVVLAAVSSLLGISLLTAPTASAAPADCPREYVCVWDNTNFQGAPRWKSKGKMTNMYTPNGASIINNGTAWAGADHIYWRYTWNDSQWSTGCLHYPPDSNAHVLYGAGTVNYTSWGDEC